MDHTRRKQSTISTQKLGKEKSMTTTDKYEVEVSLKLKTSRHNIMYNFLYSNISQFAGNLKGIFDEVRYKTPIQNMHKIGWKEN